MHNETGKIRTLNIAIDVKPHTFLVIFFHYIVEISFV